MLQTAHESSWGAVACVLAVTELLASITLRDVGFGFLVLNLNQQMSQLHYIENVPVLVCVFQLYQD